ncbi:phosphatase [Clostridium sp. chh4-2]|uniref:PHP domain-containing protein n=1 Tax=Clostridium sp. chh4-2 TaxID=2067550 RepID=UPI000CCDFCD1|nr:PHP domain-containing protein [Clostridium sp. chh4-2]PNV61519.1 phosphatase [Clostridium sp. chh4-2]
MSDIDLHMHSNISLDGEFTPDQLAKLCYENHIKTAALTDHNSVRGVDKMKQAAENYGIQIIPGIELDCICEELDLHLLGYGIDITDQRFADNETYILKQKQSNSVQTMDLLLQAGIAFDPEKVMALSRDGVVIGETIAEVALQDERNFNNPLMKPYYPGGSRSSNPYVNFFWDFCSQGKTAFIPVSYITVEEAIELVRSTGGVSVIAHPGAMVKRDEEKIAYMVECGVTGIEVYSSYHSEDDIRYYREIAEKYHLIQTVGSDFHGKTKPAVRLGGTNCEELSFDIRELIPKYR